MLEEGREVWWKFSLYYFISFHIKVSPGKSFKKRQSAFPWFLSDPATSPTFITPKRLSNNKQLLFHPHLSLESRSKANANYLDNSCKSCTFSHRLFLWADQPKTRCGCCWICNNLLREKMKPTKKLQKKRRVWNKIGLK